MDPQGSQGLAFIGNEIKLLKWVGDVENYDDEKHSLH